MIAGEEGGKVQVGAASAQEKVDSNRKIGGRTSPLRKKPGREDRFHYYRGQRLTIDHTLTGWNGDWSSRRNLVIS